MTNQGSILGLRENVSSWCLYAVLMGLLTYASFGDLSTHLLFSHDAEYLQDAAVSQDDFSFVVSPERIYPGRPTFNLYLWAAYRLFENVPAGYHLLQAWIHAIASLLAAFTFRRLGASLEICLAAGLLFLMNVAHFRAIHWISCSSYILALILGLCAVLLFWEGLERGRRGWILGSSLLLAAAVFAHASTVAIPLFCFFLAVRRTSSIQKAIYIALPQLATVAVCSIVVLAAYPNTFQAAAIVRAPQPFDMVRNLIWFWSRLASTAHWLPGFLDLEGVTHWELGAGFLFLIGSLYLSVRRGPDPCLLTWTVWSILFCLPFINSASLTGNIPGPSRYLYFASLGTSFILAWILHAIVFRLLNLSRAGERAAFLGVLSLIVVLSHFGLARAEAISLYHAGRRYIARGDHAPGVNQLKAAIARSTNILPIDVYSRLAMSSFVLGKSSESILRSALLKHPDLHELNMLLGMSELLHSDPQVREAGERQVRDAVESSVDKELLRWYAAIAYNNLATFYSGSGHKRTAIELYFNAIRSYPDYPTAICNLGRVLYDSGDRKRAADVVHSLLQLQLPDGFIMRRGSETSCPRKVEKKMQQHSTNCPPA